ncbi:phage tail fiber protein [Rhodoplanes serenus]|uniref:phage tail fiber protein n=1 Tax=Rhodoplanes serenus TaxID=200615 RepID=UPI000DAD8314|nr:hypothetical protein [Rhodoplanes serenus]RAI34521.1 hypothetical protein CH340_08825 [Rhodoplanes serenus]
MSANFTKFGRKVILDHFLGRIAYAFPVNVYMALFVADPTDEGLLSGELSQAGYARVEISALLGDVVLASGIISNSALIEFGPAGEDWPEISAIGIMDSATIGAGNMIMFGPPVTTRIVVQGEPFQIQIGQFTTRLR